MDFDLARIDYTLTGVTYPETMKLLPSTNPKTEQKIVIGDKNGVLQCLGIKNEEPHVVFKTLPGKEITSVKLAGAPGTLADKIFTASGNEVKGYTRKGKVFLALETNLSETITSMCVSGADLVIGSGRVVTHYRDLLELNTYACDDRVLDIMLLNTINSTKIRLVVAVANKGLLLLEQGKTLGRASVSAGPTRLIAPPADYQNMQDPVVFYGAMDGSIGIITFNGNELMWRCLLATAGLGAAAVSCAAWWALAGATYLLAGRHDGSVQVYLLDPDNFPDKPKLKYTYVCGERVTSVAGGCVGGAGAAEVLAATYSGRVFALRPRDRAPDSRQAVAARLASLQTEVSRLERQVGAERERYQRSTRAPLTAAAPLSAPPALHLEDELTGVLSDNWQELRLNSAVPLDLLFLYCPHPLLVQTDSVAVLSVCPPQDSKCEYLATVRCQMGTRRLCLKLRNARPREGAALRVYAVPSGAPRVAHCRRYNLVSLAHYSVYEPAEQETPSIRDEGGAWSSLTARGAFSAAEMTSWLTRALPGEAPRAAPRVSLARSHALIRTMLHCYYSKGTATFSSDNISTIAILKELLSKCSVKRSITLDMDCTVAENCVLNSFKKIEELIKEEYQKEQEAYIRKAIGELDLDTASRGEGTAPLLCSDYTRIVQAPSGDTDDKHQMLIDTVREWYSDACSLQLLPCAQAHLDRLTTALRDNRLDEAVRLLAI